VGPGAVVAPLRRILTLQLEEEVAAAEVVAPTERRQRQVEADEAPGSLAVQPIPMPQQPEEPPAAPAGEAVEGQIRTRPSAIRFSSSARLVKS
jgi:hypothetical protein